MEVKVIKSKEDIAKTIFNVYRDKVISLDKMSYGEHLVLLERIRLRIVKLGKMMTDPKYVGKIFKIIELSNKMMVAFIVFMEQGEIYDRYNPFVRLAYSKLCDLN